jgi:hypothetical protein
MSEAKKCGGMSDPEIENPAVGCGMIHKIIFILYWKYRRGIAEVF